MKLREKKRFIEPVKSGKRRIGCL